MRITTETWEKVYHAPMVSRDTMELRGYTLIEELFADSSGFGSDDEPALSTRQFPQAIRRTLEQHGPLHAVITNAGMFQVYVGLFKKNGKSRSKKVGNNTYRIELADGYAIRLHDTNVATFYDDGKIMLDSGGWKTRTTNDRINAALTEAGARFRVHTHRREWYIVPLSDTFPNLNRKAVRESLVKFHDGIVLDYNGKITTR